MKLYVPKFLATKLIAVKITDGTDENGSVKVVNEINVDARFQSSNKTVFTKEGQKISLSAKAFIFDKLSEFPEKISGKCVIDTVEYDIFNGSLKTNPDGSPNHIVLELI